MKRMSRRYVIKYEYQKELPFTRSRLRNDVSGATGYTIETSLNPFLRGYFLDMDMKSERLPLLLSFDELCEKAEKVVFFTYVTNVQYNKDKIMVMKYPYPACILEAEVRFIFSNLIRIKGRICENRQELVKNMSWTKLNNVLEKLQESSEEVSDPRCHLGWLNTWEEFKNLGMNFSLSPKQREFIALIKRYDMELIQLVKSL